MGSQRRVLQGCPTAQGARTVFSSVCFLSCQMLKAVACLWQPFLQRHLSAGLVELQTPRDLYQFCCLLAATVWCPFCALKAPAALLESASPFLTVSGTRLSHELLSSFALGQTVPIKSGLASLRGATTLLRTPHSATMAACPLWLRARVVMTLAVIVEGTRGQCEQGPTVELSVFEESCPW